jgi:hypothetical protein
MDILWTILLVTRKSTIKFYCHGLWFTGGLQLFVKRNRNDDTVTNKNKNKRFVLDVWTFGRLLVVATTKFTILERVHNFNILYKHNLFFSTSWFSKLFLSFTVDEENKKYI